MNITNYTDTNRIARAFQQQRTALAEAARKADLRQSILVAMAKYPDDAAALAAFAARLGLYV